MTNNKAEFLFREKIKELEIILRRLSGNSSLLSKLRLAIGAGIILCGFIVIKFSYYSSGSILFLSLIIIFFNLVYAHKKIEQEILYYRNLINIYKNEIFCLNEDFSNNYEGKEFIDARHPYTSDLDIYGKHSLYQFACRANTKGGREKLSSWLKAKANKEEILERQTLAKFLSEEMEWRHELNALTYPLTVRNKVNSNLPEENISNLQGWLQQQGFITEQGKLSFLIRLAQVSVIVILILGVFNIISLKFLLIPAIVNFYLRRKYRQEIEALREKTAEHTRFLKTYAKVFQHIEGKRFDNSKIQNLTTAIKSLSLKPSKELLSLSDLLYNLEATQNPYFYPIGNFLFSWDLYWINKLEKWRLKNSKEVLLWFESIYSLEAYSSIAAVAFVNPEWTWPVISDEAFIFNGVQIGHPMIRKKSRVYNNLDISGIGKCMVITGSNMSGKSTFLRTVGINTVMALAGWPVPAGSLMISSSDLFTSMRTQDSLEENTSSFYAELKRLKALLEKLNDQTVTFYLLDEILKGTNSKDRHNGAKALIYQLNKSNATGFISTHDVELGSLEEENPGKIRNYSFNSYMENGKLKFDYLLNSGVCNSFNASELMAQIGIEIKSLND